VGVNSKVQIGMRVPHLRRISGETVGYLKRVRDPGSSKLGRRRATRRGEERNPEKKTPKSGGELGSRCDGWI